jgi:YebC/PmpR family DNA-binding regulatory protein
VSGHSKWHSIKHKKGALDAKRGKIFTRIIKELTVAARVGGGDPAMNPRLRTIVADAKAANMPNDNIARAIRRGTGEEPGVSYEEVTYEGYGPGGVAVLVRCLTNNRNRAAQDVRRAFTGSGGKLAEPGAVAWMFEPKGIVIVKRASASEEDVFLLAVDAGAEDVRSSEQSVEVVTPPEAWKPVGEALEGAGVEVESAELTQVPKSTVPVDRGDAKKVLGLMDALEELDDVQEVFANFDISDDVLAEVAS